MFQLSDVSRKDEIELSKGLACYVPAILLSLMAACILLLLTTFNQITGMQGMLYTVATVVTTLTIAHVLAVKLTGFHASCKKYQLSPVEMICDFSKNTLIPRF